MCLWCGHSFSSVRDGDCDPYGTGVSCSCTITEEKQNAWMRWVQAEQPDRWVHKDWDYILEHYGNGSM